jgi:hypothetical protein
MADTERLTEHPLKTDGTPSAKQAKEKFGWAPTHRVFELPPLPQSGAEPSSPQQ